MQTITLAQVKLAARTFYAAGKLTAQHPIPGMRACVNTTDDGYRCAVAAAFDDEALRLAPTGAIDSLRGGRVVQVAPDELDAVRDIQRAHDMWAIDAGLGSPLTDAKRAAFVKLIEAE